MYNCFGIYTKKDYILNNWNYINNLYKNNPIKDCIKLSDSEGKHLGPEKDIEICKYECDI